MPRKPNTCSALQNKILDLVRDEDDFTCVFDYDGTLVSEDTGEPAPCARKIVDMCPRLAIDSYNAAVRPQDCCKDPVLKKLGLCINGKCQVPKDKWAYRRAGRFVLGKKVLGGWADHWNKGTALWDMKLDPRDTVFFDDQPRNRADARRAGYIVPFTIKAKTGIA